MASEFLSLAYYHCVPYERNIEKASKTGLWLRRIQNILMKTILPSITLEKIFVIILGSEMNTFWRKYLLLALFTRLPNF